MYYVDTSTGAIEQIDIPDDVEVVDDSYLVEKHERDTRIGAFAEAVDNKKAVNLDFKNVVNTGLKSAKFKHKGTKNMVMELMDGQSD